jgi:hypothetical protein
MFVLAIGIRTTCVMTRLPVLLTDCGDGVMALGAGRLTAPGDWLLAARPAEKVLPSLFLWPVAEAGHYLLANRAV